MGHTPARASLTHPDLERVYLLWRERSASRWTRQLGDDAGDLLSEVWLRLSRMTAFEHTSDQATLRYIESVAAYALKDRRRVEARRRELFAGAVELGVRGLTQKAVEAPVEAVEPPVDMRTVIDASGLTRQQRIVIVGLWQGVERSTLALMLEVTMETVREYERAGIARMREKTKEMGK